MKLIYALCGLLLANAAWAVPDVVVDGVRMPAWVERGAQRQPLAVGMELRSGDVLVTGQNSRVLLKSADGSDIRLGENAEFDLSSIGRQHEAQPVFSAVLDVVKGAFRFTTSQLGKLRERQVTIKVANATLGIRGTDVWGKAAASGDDLVVLIEGRISVTHGNEAPFIMDQPLTSFVMPKGAAPLPLAKIDQVQLAKLALETEISPGQGAVRSGGRWKVNLMELDGEPATLEAYDALRAAGYDVRILPLQAGKYRLRIIQLPSRAEAEALARDLSGKMGIVAPGVSR
ncbi:MAG: hypothetical protein GC139_07775 [Sideroxydans sp.]|nr:hypothetical protein [Sideroxydans sp.]